VKTAISQNDLNALVEKLANAEHNRWSHWQKYMHSRCERRADGSLLIPADLVLQWERQLATPYEELSEKEKASDREQVHKYLPVLLKAFGVDRN
jgi:hypothetical protein